MACDRVWRATVYGAWPCMRVAIYDARLAFLPAGVGIWCQHIERISGGLTMYIAKPDGVHNVASDKNEHSGESNVLTYYTCSASYVPSSESTLTVKGWRELQLLG